MHSFSSQTCIANGINIHYYRTGGKKPPALLLHGLMTSGACWTLLARTLEADYDVIMPDARGHGHSSALESGYNYETLATDVFSLINALELTSPVIIGHSMGGMTAAVFASRYPKRLKGLILADPTFLTKERQEEVQRSDVAEQHRSILNRSKEEYLAEVRSRSSRSAELISFLVEARFQTSMHAFEILRSPNPDYKMLMQALTAPCLLVTCDTNPVVSHLLAKELTSLNEHVKVKQIKKSGHGIPFDQPECFSHVVKDFLQSIFKS